MDLGARRSELKTFLRARRAALTPEAVGLPRGPRRLTPGLRREEVAALAGVGVTWYTWLEQGREINVSDDTLERVSRALRLSPSDKAYVFTLVGLPLRQRYGTTISEALRLTIRGFTAGPAMLMNPAHDVLVCNDLWDAVYPSKGVDAGRLANNHLWRLFMDPERQELYKPGYLDVARTLTLVFRVFHARHPGDTNIEELREALTAGSPLFVELWNERTTRPLDSMVVRLNHPSLGPLVFNSARATPCESSAYTMAINTPADEPTAEAMRRLVGLANAASPSWPPVRGRSRRRS